MKKILLLLFILSFYEVKGQVIHLVDTTNTWRVHSIQGMVGEDIECIYLMHLGSDTIINNQTWRPMISQTIFRRSAQGFPCVKPVAFFREDTSSQKVWCIWLNTYNSSVDTTSQLIYNGNWQVGDTIKAGLGTSSNPYAKGIVQSISSTNINGIPHKVFKVNSPNSSSPQFSIIEGVGSTL